MTSFQNLTELEDAIVRYVQDKSPNEEDLVSAFESRLFPKNIIKKYIIGLEKGHAYIALSDKLYLKPGVFSLDAPSKDEDYEHLYEITALGKAYLARSTANFTSFSNITNSNIAHESPHAIQTIKISELSEDLQNKIEEFDDAAANNDGKAMMKVLGYIADKSVDVAIATITGALMR